MRSAAASALLAATLAGVPGCGYILTYDQAFAPEPVDFPRWDPPDTLVDYEVVPPPVEAVILDAQMYYVIHPPGEEDSLSAALREARARRAALAAAADTAGGAADTAAVDTLGASPAETHPPVEIDLTDREAEVLVRVTRVDMERAEVLLILLESDARVAEEERDQIDSVRSYLTQTRAALERRDFKGSAKLAFKARTLAESLERARP